MMKLMMGIAEAAAMQEPFVSAKDLLNSAAPAGDGSRISVASAAGAGAAVISVCRRLNINDGSSDNNAKETTSKKWRLSLDTFRVVLGREQILLLWSGLTGLTGLVSFREDTMLIR